MAFESKFDLLSPIKQKEIIDYAREHGAYPTAKQYASGIGMSEAYLAIKLNKLLNKQYDKEEKELEEEPKVTPKGKNKNDVEPERVLTKKEKQFLKDLEEGRVGLEESSRIVAVHVFTQMLKNPNKFHYVDFFRTELLKLKQQENTDRNNYASELMNRMFGGYLPPRFCPKCGTEVIKLSTVVNGEVISERGQVNESLPATRNS